MRAERTLETKDRKEGRTRSEFRYGSFERALRMPEGVAVDDITATHKDGILEVRLPYKVSTEAQPTRVVVTTT